MPRSFIVRLALFIKKIFYFFLDVSGVLLGVFLTGLGWWILAGREVGRGLGVLILFLGICAMLIHLGHYYSWKLTRWIFGSGDYFITRAKNGNGDEHAEQK